MEKNQIESGYYVNGLIYIKKPSFPIKEIWNFFVDRKYADLLGFLGPFGADVLYVLVAYESHFRPVITLYYAKPIPTWKRIR